MKTREQYQGQPAEGFKPLEEWGGVEALSDEELEAWRRSPVSLLEARVIARIDTLERQWKDAEALAERRKEALKPFLDAVPPNPDSTDADEVKVFGLQMDELDIANARATIEEAGKR